MKKGDSYVDITKESVVTCVEWFHGYGGNALGLKRAIPGLCSIAVCERDAFVVANMVSKMEKGLLDAVPIWTDVTDFPTEPFGCGVLDLFIASYPCQGFSHAGKRLGTNDPRHLWPYCRKFIVAVRPGWVWLENVEGHVSLGLSTVLADLEEDGYTAAWGIFSASEVGAPHQRKRVFILARDSSMEKPVGAGGWGEGGNTLHQRRTSGETWGEGVPKATRWENGSTISNHKSTGSNELALRDSIGCSHGEPKEQPAEAGVNALCNPAAGGGEDVAHLRGQGSANGISEQGQWQEGFAEELGNCGERGGVWPSRPGERQYAWEPPRVVGYTGLQRQEERCLQAAGLEQSNKENGVVGNAADCGHESKPQMCAEPAGRAAEMSGQGLVAGDTGGSQAQPPMGGNAYGPADGLDFPGCTGLSDTELEEIYGWMERGTNRTDELRMCGNGVVPATAERAFRVLYAEIIGHRGAGDAVLEEEK